MQLKKATTCITIFLLFSILCLTLAPQNVSSKTQDIKILSYSHYIDNLGYLEVVGEIQNTGSNTIHRALLTATAYGTDGTIQCVISGYAWLSYMGPQQKSPFRIELQTPDDYNNWYEAGVSRITVAVNEATEISSHLYSNFEVSVNDAGITASGPNTGCYFVRGTIRNVGSQTASKLAVAAVFYNSEGTVVAIGRTDYLSPTNVNPSSTVTFNVYAFDTIQTNEPENRQITGYSLFVQADSPLIDGKATTATSVTGTSIASQPSDSSTQQSNMPFNYILIIVAVVVTIVVSLLLSRKNKNNGSEPANIEASSKKSYKKPAKK
jgi:preprotein translocase subunit SecG